jgi:hypothetical protein
MRKNHVENFIDEVHKVLVVGTYISRGVDGELDGCGVERICELVKRGTMLEVGSWPAGPDEAIIATASRNY